MQEIVRRPTSSLWSRRLHTLELWTLLVFSVLPHAAVAAAVAANPEAFTIKVCSLHVTVSHVWHLCC